MQKRYLTKFKTHDKKLLAQYEYYRGISSIQPAFLTVKKLNVFYPRSGIKQGCPLLLLKGMALEVLARVIRQENKIKGM